MATRPCAAEKRSSHGVKLKESIAAAVTLVRPRGTTDNDAFAVLLKNYTAPQVEPRDGSGSDEEVLCPRTTTEFNFKNFYERRESLHICSEALP